jgi:transposase
LFPVELFGGPGGSRLDHSVVDIDCLTVFVEMTTPSGSCPLCGSDAHRIHSRYPRHLTDLPGFSLPVRLQVMVRRFFCPHPLCSRRIFAERLAGFARPYARTTDRLRQAHGAIGFALGGEAGSRLTIRLSMTTSPDTLLRRVKQFKDHSAPPPRFVGIDEWAWRKGRRYGTIVVDLERGNIVDLLPNRDAETVKKWLNDHPGVELVSRDRSAAFAQASTEAAPQAQQVADRWHLLKNLREAVERLFERQSTVVSDALQAAEAPAQHACGTIVTETGDSVPTAELPSSPPASQPSQAAMEPGVPGQVEGSSSRQGQESERAGESRRVRLQRARRQKRVARFEEVHQRRRNGQSAHRIARELGMSRNAVRRYLRIQTCPDWMKGQHRRSTADPWREWIDARLAEGFTNVVELHRQLTAQGYRGSYYTLRRYVAQRLAATGKKRGRINAITPVPPTRPSAKRLSFEWVRRREKRKPDEQSRLDAIRAGSDELATALDLADEFAALIRNQSSATLSDWLIRGEACSNQELRRFAEGIRRDEAAVLAAVTQRWSNGPVEGHINRLKTVKRQMYGRAGFVLLRARVINAA